MTGRNCYSLASFFLGVALCSTLEELSALGGLADLRRADLIAVTPDNSRLVVYGRGVRYEHNPEQNVPPVFQVWDLTTDTLVVDLELPVGYVFGLAIAPDGAHVAVGCGSDGICHIYNVASGDCRDVDLVNESGVELAGFSADSSRVLFTPMKVIPLSLVFVDVSGGDRLERPADDILSALCSPTTDEVFAIRWLGRSMLGIEVLSSSSLKPKRKIKVEPIGSTFGISANGRFLVTARKRIIQVIDVDNSSTITELRRKDDKPEVVMYSAVSVSSDGRWVATRPNYGGRPQAELWNVKSKEMAQLGPETKQPVFMPNDILVVAAGSRGLKFFNLQIPP